MSDHTPSLEALRREFEYRIRTAVTFGIGRGKPGDDMGSQQKADWIQHEIDKAMASLNVAGVIEAVRAEEREKAAQIAEQVKPTRQYTDAEMLYMVCLALEEGIDGVRRIDLDDLLIKMIAEHWGTADEDSLPDEAEAAFAQLEPYIPEFPDWGRKIAARIREQGAGE